MSSDNPALYRTLGGTFFTFNCFERDYCFEQVLESMLPVCDQVAIIDCFSTDGTFETLLDWQKRHPKIDLHQTAWTPNYHGQWMTDLTNQARLMLRTNMHLSLQADEVLDPKEYDLLLEYARAGKLVTFRRFNFRGSAKHITPFGRGGGGDWLTRLAPVTVPAIGDGGELAKIGKEFWNVGLHLYHYTQVRKPVAFAIKCKEMVEAMHGPQSDPILEEIREHGMKMLCESKSGTAIPWNEMVPFEGQHPQNMIAWLLERGYAV